jgi:hypothetical protein
MVQVKYKGLNTLFVGGYAFKAGLTEVKDEDFWNLMKTKLFKYRVEQKILEVPADFPLEKPKKKPESKDESSDVQADDSPESVDEKGDRLSVKATLKLIEKSEDADYLQSLIDKDGREKVIEEAKKKLATFK